MIFQMFSILQEPVMSNPLDGWLVGLENFCIAFNDFSLLFFQYMKYIFIFILILAGTSTLLKFRGMYRISRVRDVFSKEEKGNMNDALKTPRLIVGLLYIFIAFGILFNFVTYFLIISLDPLPDRLIFTFINFSELIDPAAMNRIQDINNSIYPHEKTIYYCFAMGSFGALVDLFVSTYYLVNNTNQNYKSSITLLIAGVTTGILVGFTTCLPFFL